MNFERGQNPKKIMGIGIRKKASDVLLKLVDENRTVMIYPSARERIMRSFNEEVGLELKIEVTMDREGLYFKIKFPGEDKPEDFSDFIYPRNNEF